VEVYRNSRCFLVLVIIGLLSFVSGCTTLDKGFNQPISQAIVESVITSETKKYVRVVCMPPVMCCISYENIENNNNNEYGICIGM
jgi:hypothetical protein